MMQRIEQRSFQYHLLQCAIMLNNRLSHMNIVDDNKCTFCKLVPKNYYHFFWECPITQRFWKDVMTCIKNQLNITVKLEFKDIILGNFNSNKYCASNLIIMVAKQWLSYKSLPYK